MKRKLLLLLVTMLTVTMMSGTFAYAQIFDFVENPENLNADYDIGAYNAPRYGNLIDATVTDADNAYLGGICLDGNGIAYTWGWNGHGQIGVNKDDVPIPAVGTDRDEIPSYFWETLTYSGGYTPVDFFTNPERYNTSELAAPTRIIDVDAGYHHMVVLDEEGRVWSWGYNVDNQTGQQGLYQVFLPRLVKGLPSDIVRVWGNNGYLDRGQSFALTSQGEVWTWGSNLNGKHGVGTITNTPAYQATPNKVSFPAGTVITDVQGGDYHNVALDNQGKVWVWGYGLSGLMGDGKNQTYTVPTVMAKPAGMGDAVKISVSYGNSLILDSNNQVWQWGHIFVGPTTGHMTIVSKPRIVNVEASEISRVGYTPVAQNIGAGESVCYFIDQFGRSWAWGSNRYFGFGREGGYETNNTIVSDTALQFPQVIGDGDTQIYDYNPKTPADGKTKSNANLGTYGFNMLHPTIYDDKYAGAGPEDAWQELALQEIPMIKEIIGSRSGYLILDYDGNMFKWSNDGSGSVAWGDGEYFDSRYDLTGNGRDGNYDSYCYEVMLARPGSFSKDAPKERTITVIHNVQTAVNSTEYTVRETVNDITAYDGDVLTSSSYAKTFEGYVYSNANPETLTVSAENTIINLYYNMEAPKQYTLTVNHNVQDPTDSAQYWFIDSDPVTVNDGTVVTSSDYVKTFGTFVYSHANPATLTISGADATINLYYNLPAPEARDVIIKHNLETSAGSLNYLETTREILNAHDGDEVAGVDYQMTFDGYEYSHSSPATLNVSATETSIDLFYNKKIEQREVTVIQMFPKPGSRTEYNEVRTTITKTVGDIVRGMDYMQGSFEGVRYQYAYAIPEELTVTADDDNTITIYYRRSL